jgi:hypothetical protein
MEKQTLIFRGLIFSLAFVVLVILIGCDSGGSGMTGPGGTATLQGQILKEPAIQLTASREGIWNRLWALFGISEAQAASTQPVSNMRVNLSVNGQSMGTMMTDSYGRFRFDGMPSGIYDIMVQDQTGRYNFNHSLNMGMGQMMATYCTIWEGGGNLQMTCTEQGGDQWDEMMQGGPGNRWNMDNHRWMM